MKTNPSKNHDPHPHKGESRATHKETINEHQGNQATNTQHPAARRQRRHKLNHRLWHTVEFSRIKRTPQPAQRPTRGQPPQPYRRRALRANPVLHAPALDTTV
jgi:hypothetical protein